MPNAHWQSIETAPRDGTAVLYVVRGEWGIQYPANHPGPKASVVIGYRDDSYMNYDEEDAEPGVLRINQQGPDCYSYTATHWMPLPALPDA